MTDTVAQHWDPERYKRTAGFVAELGAPVVELLAPVAGEHILDLGCGDGLLTARLAAGGCDVLGVDASPDMVAATQARGLPAAVMDGASLSFDAQFDAVFSNAALHWMTDYQGVLAGVFTALRPGGRFVAEFGGYGNVAAVESALQNALAERDVHVPSPWFFPRPEAYRAALEAAGFVVNSIEHFARPTPQPGDIRAWILTFGNLYLGHIDTSEHEAVVDAAVAALEPALRDTSGQWFVDYVRIRVHAHRPAEKL